MCNPFGVYLLELVLLLNAYVHSVHCSLALAPSIRALPLWSRRPFAKGWKPEDGSCKNAKYVVRLLGVPSGRRARYEPSETNRLLTTFVDWPACLDCRYRFLCWINWMIWKSFNSKAGIPIPRQRNRMSNLHPGWLLKRKRYSNG